MISNAMKIDNTQDHEIIPMDIGIPVFVVTAYRWGSRKDHSYVVGVFESADIALTSATNEESFRSNGYVCEVVEMRMNYSIWDRGCKTIKRLTNDHDSRKASE
jgi:hypothetical protein